MDLKEEVDGAGDTVADEGPAFGGGGGGGGIEFAPARLVTLPILSLGTRVCIFCSRIFTRARISETIWTPLLLVAVIGTLPVVFDELVLDVLRLTAGRGAGVRLGARDGVDESDETVLEREKPEIPPAGVDNIVRGRCWASRCIEGLCEYAGTPGDFAVRGVVNKGDSFVGLSFPADKSVKERSGGIGMLRRLSSDTDGVLGDTIDDGAEEPDSVAVVGRA